MEAIRMVSNIEVTKKAFSLLDEFKRFAFKGNVIDLAVGVIIGSAFGKLVDSLVKSIFMPLISLLMPSEQGYLQWKLIMGAKEVPYGLFIGEILNFIVVAVVIFLFMVKFLGWLTKEKKAQSSAPTPPPPPASKEQILLEEIRDLLKEGAARGGRPTAA